MTKNNAIANEAKIKAWASKNPKFKPFLGNMAMLAKLYANHFKPDKVSECIEDQEAKLTLLITKKVGAKTMKLCSECNRRPGTACSEQCGEGDFVDMEGVTYSAGDATGEIMITIPPWAQYNKELDIEEVYIVEGSIRKYKTTLQIQPNTEIKPIPTDNSEAISALKELMEMHDGEVPTEMLSSAMQGYEGELESAIEELGLIEVDGVLKYAS